MKKTIAIIAICALLVVPVVTTFAENNFLIGGGDTVTAGGQIGFKIDLEKIGADEHTPPYKITVSVTPSEPKLWLDVKENVKVFANKVNGTYELDSSDLKALKALNVIMSPDAGLKESVEYTVTVNVTGLATPLEEKYTFEAVPKAEKKDGKSGGGSYSGGGDFGGGEDSKYTYNGSADNYLKELAVDGHKFTENFDKTRSTYFLDVDKKVTKLNVRAVPCDSKTRVDIVGNNDISAQMSKVTVSLKAENGDIRLYRIYVRHQEAK